MPTLPDLNIQPNPAKGMRKQPLSYTSPSQTPLSSSSHSMQSYQPSHGAGQRSWRGVKPYPPQLWQRSASSWPIWHGPPMEHQLSQQQKASAPATGTATIKPAADSGSKTSPPGPPPRTSGKPLHGVRRRWSPTASRSGKPPPFKCGM